MGGPVGVLSSKFVVSAGLLLVSARIDMHRVTAAIDPSAPMTLIAPELAAQLDQSLFAPKGDAQVRHHVLAIDHTELSIDHAMIAKPVGRAQVTIGADLLSKMIIGFDFARSRVDVLDRSAYRKAGKGMTAVPVEIGADRCLRIEGRGSSQNEILVALAGSWAEDSQATQPDQLHVGDLVVGRYSRDPGPCRESMVSVGWSSFSDQRILLDLGRRRMWTKAASTLPPAGPQ